jgi:nucleotide-binding universal stress UspA family protein
MSAASTIVVGILPNRPTTVIEVAVGIAQGLRARLVCVSVEPVHVIIDIGPDGIPLTAAYDPDATGLPEPRFEPALAEQISRIADRRGIACEFEMRVDDPARALSAVAEENDALLIVVGARRASAAQAVREFFSGSVAARLSHQQHRPVLVVPVDPTGFDAPLPWESAE